MNDTINGAGVFKIEKHRVVDGVEDLIPYETRTVENLWINTGWTEILKLITGESANHFNVTNSRLGVGDSSTAAGATQTDLQAATNKTYKTMESGYPTTPSSQTILFRSKYTTSEANYAWQEVVLKNASSGYCWNRAVSSLGTKSNREVWYITLTIGKA